VKEKEGLEDLRVERELILEQILTFKRRSADCFI